MDPKQQQRLRDAVDRKVEEERAQAVEQDQQSAARHQDTYDVRAKNSGHGKKTADKWNQ